VRVQIDRGIEQRSGEAVHAECRATREVVRVVLGMVRGQADRGCLWFFWGRSLPFSLIRSQCGHLTFGQWCA